MSKVKALLEHGDTFTKGGNEFEVITVSCQTDENNQPTVFFYEVVLKTVADERRKVEEQTQA